MFKLVSDYKPTGDQPQAIDYLVKGINEGKKYQTLLGVTGSRKNLYNGKYNPKNSVNLLLFWLITKHLQVSFIANLKSFFRKTMLSILWVTTIIINQKVICRKQILTLKKMLL